MKHAPKEIKQQLNDNIQWIDHAQQNKLVVGSQARILYADSEGRIKIAEAFNKAIKAKKLKHRWYWVAIITMCRVRIRHIAIHLISMTVRDLRLIWLCIIL